MSEWRQVNIIGLWGRRNQDLQTKPGRLSFAQSAGYEVQYGNQIQLAPFGDVAFRLTTEQTLAEFVPSDNPMDEKSDALLAGNPLTGPIDNCPHF